MRMIKTIALLALVALVTGCASVTRGSYDSLEVNSTPDQANIKVYRTNAGFTAKEIKNNTVEDPSNPGAGPLIATTPASFKLARKGNYKVVIEKEGYKTTEIEIGNKISTAGGASLAGNALAGGIVGVIVDSRTGAGKDLTPNPVEVTLEEGEGTVFIALPSKKDNGEEATKEKASDETQQNVNGVILSGYDAVSYFTENKAVKGYAGISALHEGAIYHFRSVENRDLFKANPTKYAPQYGGFCAYGVAINRKFSIDPTVFAIVDDKLYVNNSAAVSETWTEDRAEYITDADKNWVDIKSKPAAEL